MSEPTHPLDDDEEEEVEEQQYRVIGMMRVWMPVDRVVEVTSDDDPMDVAQQEFAEEQGIEVDATEWNEADQVIVVPVEEHQHWTKHNFPLPSTYTPKGPCNRCQHPVVPKAEGCRCRCHDEFAVEVANG